jgi:hypothetical protein
MRYRQRSSSGDMIYGHGSADFFIDSPQAVQQAVVTGLRLFLGEFFLDTSAGMPWLTQVIGPNTRSTYDNAIKNQILSTTGVTGIANYSSSLNPTTRLLTVSVTVQSAYGNIAIAIPFVPPYLGGFGVGGFAVAGFGE